MTTLKPDAFEEIFLKLEEESERRALEDNEAALSPNIPELAIAAQRAQRGQRNRGSVSISRFGHVDEDTDQRTSLGSSQMPPAAFMTTLAPLYMAQSHVCLPLAGCACQGPMCWADGSFVAQNHSADSLSGDSFFGDDAGLYAESDHVTQVRRIAGRQSLPRSVGGILHRTLTRSRTDSGLSSSGINVVVGVVVQEDHVEESEPREGLPRRATVYAQSTSRLSSRITIPGAEKRVSWRSKAGELLRRKARPRRSTIWSITPSQES